MTETPTMSPLPKYDSDNYSTPKKLRKKCNEHRELKSEEVVAMMKKITRFLEHEFGVNQTGWEMAVGCRPDTPPRTKEHSSRGMISPRPTTSRNCCIQPPSPETETTVKSRTRVTRREKDTLDELEIEPGSGVYVAKTYLKTDVRKFASRSSEMVRRLMLYLIGAAELKEMTARGTKTKKGIPSRILSAVKYYVDEYGDGKMDEQRYIRIINQQISSLRCPKVERRHRKEAPGTSNELESNED